MDYYLNVEGVGEEEGERIQIGVMPLIKDCIENYMLIWWAAIQYCMQFFDFSARA